MLKVSHEVFSELYEESTKFNDFDYALAPLVLTNEKYRDFYNKQSLRGREVWLDNGAFELGHPLPFKDIIKAARLIGATHFIFPDILQNAKQTMANYKKYKDKVKTMKHIVCVQGKTEEEFMECYRYFAGQKDIDIIAIPFAIKFYDNYLNLDSKRWAFSRQIIIDKLIAFGGVNYDKKHHLLGCIDPLEFKRYRDGIYRYRFIKSIDTSCPIALGYEHRTLTEKMGFVGDKPKMLMMENIDQGLTNLQKNIIRQNVTAFAKIIGKK